MLFQLLKFIIHVPNSKSWDSGRWHGLSHLYLERGNHLKGYHESFPWISKAWTWQERRFCMSCCNCGWLATPIWKVLLRCSSQRTSYSWSVMSVLGTRGESRSASARYGPSLIQTRAVSFPSSFCTFHWASELLRIWGLQLRCSSWTLWQEE